MKGYSIKDCQTKIYSGFILQYGSNDDISRGQYENESGICSVFYSGPESTTIHHHYPARLILTVNHNGKRHIREMLATDEEVLSPKQMAVYAGKFLRQIQAENKDIIGALKKELIEDSNYFDGWKANIAMSIYDKIGQKIEEKGGVLNLGEIHKCCNSGAETLLNNLRRNK